MRHSMCVRKSEKYLGCRIASLTLTCRFDVAGNVSNRIETLLSFRYTAEDIHHPTSGRDGKSNFTQQKISIQYIPEGFIIKSGDRGRTKHHILEGIIQYPNRGWGTNQTSHSYRKKKKIPTHRGKAFIIQPGEGE